MVIGEYTVNQVESAEETKGVFWGIGADCKGQVSRECGESAAHHLRRGGEPAGFDKWVIIDLFPC